MLSELSPYFQQDVFACAECAVLVPQYAVAPVQNSDAVEGSESCPLAQEALAAEPAALAADRSSGLALAD